MAAHDLPFTSPNGSGCLDILHRTNVSCCRKGHSGYGRNQHHTDGNHYIEQTAANNASNGYGQNDRGKRKQHIAPAHDEIAHEPTMKPGNDAKNHTDYSRNRHRNHGAGQGHTPSPQEAAENIPALAIDAKRMARCADGLES